MEKRKKLEAAASNENNFRVHALPVENIYSPEPKSMRGTGKENPLYDFLIDINKGKNTIFHTCTYIILSTNLLKYYYFYQIFIFLKKYISEAEKGEKEMEQSPEDTIYSEIPDIPISGSKVILQLILKLFLTIRIYYLYSYSIFSSIKKSKKICNMYFYTGIIDRIKVK